MARTPVVGLLFLVLSAAFATAHTATPIEKVVELLKKLSAQIAEEGKVEAAEYDKYACFCKEQADEKNYAIETSTKKIAVMKAKQEELKASISELNQDITDLGKKIGTLENGVKTASDTRAGELAEYEKQAKDLTDAVSACARAIEALKESKGDIDGKVDLAQISASSPLVAAALLEQAPAKYEYSSNEILATLQGLLGKFKANKAELDTDEFNAKGAFELKKQDMLNQKTFAEKSKDEKETESEGQSETLAETTEEKTDETKAMDADSEFLKVLTGECETKAVEYDQRSSTRSSEIAAITKALGDLQKNAVGNYEATGLSDLQKAAPSFLQLRSSPGKASLLAKSSGTSRIAVTQSVLDLLMRKTGTSNSPVLASLTMKLTILNQQEGIDHFVKVRTLIKDLLTKLDADAKSEATTKSYCDKNMKKQTEARDSAKLTIEEKLAAIKIANAEKAETTQKIADLNAAIADNMKGLMEATELREEDKAANLESIRMSAEGKKSVEFALGVLTEFYSKAFVQKAAYTPPKSGRDGKTVGDMAPKITEGEYHGNTDASKGILGILEVIAADFQRTHDTVEKDEADAEKKFQLFKKTTEDDNEAKGKELKAGEKKVSDLKDTLVTLTDDKMGAEKNLESAQTTLEDLKKMCVDGEETYSERVAKRQEEIDALKEALEIFENWKA